MLKHTYLHTCILYLTCVSIDVPRSLTGVISITIFAKPTGVESVPRIFSTYENLGDTGVKCKFKIWSNYRNYLRIKEMTKENKEKNRHNNQSR